MTDWKEAELEDIENEGKRVGKEITSSNYPDAIDVDEEEYLNKSKFKEKLMEELSEALDNYKAHTPFEFFAKELNEREDSDDAWDYFEEGVSEAFSNFVDEFDDKTIPITEELGEKLTKNMLGELYEVNIGGKTLDAGEILYEVDQDYFDQVMNDYLDSIGLEVV